MCGGWVNAKFEGIETKWGLTESFREFGIQRKVAAISADRNGDNENLELVRDGSPVAAVDMEIDNRNEVLEALRIAESAISNLGWA